MPFSFLYVDFGLKVAGLIHIVKGHRCVPNQIT